MPVLAYKENWKSESGLTCGGQFAGAVGVGCGSTVRVAVAAMQYAQ